MNPKNASETKPNGDDWMIFVAAALPLLAAVIFLLGAPRPYHIYVGDLEQTYYYSAKLVLAGEWFHFFNHPGTPAVWLGAMVMALTGSAISEAQEFFHAMYILQAVLLGISLLVLGRTCVRETGGALYLLFTAVLLSFGPVLFYLNAYGADSFVVPALLAGLAAFWSSFRKFSANRLLPAGLFFGLAGAFKMVVLPVLAWSILVVLWHCGNRSGNPTRGATGFLAYALGGAAGFFLPTITHYNLWRDFFFEQLLNQSRSGSSIIPPFFADYWAVLILCLGALFGGLVYLFRKPVPAVGGESGFDCSAAWLRSFGGTLGLIYLLLKIGRPVEGMAWVNPWLENLYFITEKRRMLLGSLVPVSFALLTAFPLWHQVRQNLPHHLQKAAAPALAGLALLVCGVHFSLFAAARADYITEIKSNQQEFREFLEELPSENIAIWEDTGDFGYYAGPVAFHGWGNFRYAREMFDAELLEEYYPAIWPRLRVVHANGSVVQADYYDFPHYEGTGRFGIISDIYWNFRTGKLISPIFKGHTSPWPEGYPDERPDFLLLPLNQVIKEFTEGDEFFEEKLGYARKRKSQKIGHLKWLIYEPATDVEEPPASEAREKTTARP